MFRKIARLFGRPRAADLGQFRELFGQFQQILKNNNRVLELISELEDKLGGDYIFDINFLKETAAQLSESVYIVCSSLNVLTGNKYRDLFSRQSVIRDRLDAILQGHTAPSGGDLVIGYDEVYSDMADLAGAKNANLGEISNHLKMLTPAGFVITTAAYHRFMAHNDLWPKIHSLRQAHLGDNPDPRNYNAGIDRLFADSHIPKEVAGDIEDRLGSLRKAVPGKLRLAVRSSAFGEDTSARSFAGQFVSYLNCGGNELLSSYSQVLAGRFKHSIFEYAGETMFRENELPMAVGVQAMVDAGVAGVAYSVDPSGEIPETLAISAAPGLGTGVVGGTADIDLFKISRLDPTQIVSVRLGHKVEQAVASESTGVVRRPVPDGLQDVSCLTDSQVNDLAERVLLLERYFRRPVDVEWCFGRDQQLYILQCRPLKLTAAAPKRSASRRIAPPDTPILMKKQGQVAQRGIAAGRVRQIHEDDDPGSFPVGAIAVTKYTTPRLTSIIRRASAIITDVGSPSGHMATVAREFGVPMIVNTGSATRTLPGGTEVTVDAEENVVYRGIVKELLAYKAEAEDMYLDLREYQMLRQILRLISPLYMIDPTSPEFIARNCRTYHDIVRFSHEMAVRFLINLNISSRRFRGVETRELKLPIPLGLHMIDLGGGLVSEGGREGITSVDDILSLPMHAIIRGLTTPGVWSTQPMQLGFGDLVSSLTRYSMTDRGAVYRGQNLAVISDHYANVSLRLGYHFNVIDTYVSKNVNDNYVYFRFVGGVTENERRQLRAVLIKEILEKLNFRVTLRGDLVVARLKKLHEKEVLGTLREIGRLIGFTRQLDTQMESEQSVVEGFNAFFDSTRSES